MISVSYGIVIEFGFLINNRKYNNYSSFVYNGFVVLVTLVAYIFILIQIKRSSNAVGGRDIQTKTVLIPFFIVLTFFAFNFVPPIITRLATIPKEYAQVTVVGFIGLNTMSFFFDPIVYIYLQPRIRHLMCNLFKSFRSRITALISVCSRNVNDKSGLTQPLLVDSFGDGSNKTLSSLEQTWEKGSTSNSRQICWEFGIWIAPKYFDNFN